MNNIVDLSSESPDNNSDVELVDVDLDITRSLNDTFDSEDIIPELGDFIKKCLNIESSKGMLRVIKKSLLRVYQEASPEYIKGNNFRNIICETTQLLEKNPQFKFSYIKSLCEKLKNNNRKRKAELITLGPCKKRKKHLLKTSEVIISDDSTDSSALPHVIIDHIHISDSEESNLDDHTLSTQFAVGNSQNVINEQKTGTENDFQYVTNTPEMVDENSSQNVVNQQTTDENDQEKEIKENMFLGVQKVVDVNYDESICNKIKAIEIKIAHFKSLIDKLEMAEVTNDTNVSPYIQCEAYKNKIVNLYNELCELTNCEPVKRHEIRLKPINACSEGPAKILETILNRNLRRDGYPPFPTFHEVNTCVKVANIKFSLNWSPQQIDHEALRLFTECGRALQKLRQKREWSNLMSLVKTEFEDPADKDPELSARLEANKRVAIVKENEILERYVMLEKSRKGHVLVSKGESIGESPQNAEDSDSSECSSASDIIWEDYDSLVKNINFKPILIKSEVEETQCENVKPENETNGTDINALLNGLGNDFTTKIADIEDPYITIEISDNSDEET